MQEDEATYDSEHWERLLTAIRHIDECGIRGSSFVDCKHAEQCCEKDASSVTMQWTNMGCDGKYHGSWTWEDGQSK